MNSKKTLDVATLTDSSLVKLHYEVYSCRHTDLLVLIGGADFVEDHPADGQEIDYVGCFRNVTTRQNRKINQKKRIGEENCRSSLLPPSGQYCSAPLTTEPGQGDEDM